MEVTPMPHHRKKTIAQILNECSSEQEYGSWTAAMTPAANTIRPQTSMYFPAVTRIARTTGLPVTRCISKMFRTGSPGPGRSKDVLGQSFTPPSRHPRNTAPLPPIFSATPPIPVPRDCTSPGLHFVDTHSGTPGQWPHPC